MNNSYNYPWGSRSTQQNYRVPPLHATLLERARTEIRNLPESVEGDGGRGRLWRAARTTCELGLDIENAFDVLDKEFNPRCRPPWSERDLRRTLQDAFSADADYLPTAPALLDLDPAIRDSVCETIVTEEELSALAPPPCEEPDPVFYLEALFGESNPLLCLAKTMKSAETKRLKEWLENIANFQFVVPSPMSARTGFCKHGPMRQGPRTLDNTGPRKYLVVEFDLVEKDKQGNDTKDAAFIRSMMERGCSIRDISAALLAHLATKGPLVMVVSSGGKSLHGWFRVEGKPEDVVRPFFQYACRLGADRRLWTACQLVRLPDGTRDNGAQQNVIFFNPTLL